MPAVPRAKSPDAPVNRVAKPSSQVDKLAPAPSANRPPTATSHSTTVSTVPDYSKHFTALIVVIAVALTAFYFRLSQ